MGRGNTNPCTVCEYCDETCDVCMHQPYENTISSNYQESFSCDEAEHGNESTDFDSGSDEEGSWFTTPWSKLIKERVAGYEIDPNIGVELTPIGNEPEDEQVAEQQKSRRKNQQQEEKREDINSRRHRKEKRRRRRRKEEETVNAAEASAKPSSSPMQEPKEVDRTEPLANDAEAKVEYFDSVPTIANGGEDKARDMLKDPFDCTWTSSIVVVECLAGFS